MTAAKEVELAVDADGDGFADPGDTLRYLIRVGNISRRPVAGLVISDELPAHTSYVAGSALLDRGGGPAALPDDPEPTFFPLDEGGRRSGRCRRAPPSPSPSSSRSTTLSPRTCARS